MNASEVTYTLGEKIQTENLPASRRNVEHNLDATKCCLPERHKLGRMLMMIPPSGPSTLQTKYK